jgi:hypothetical protein
VTFPAVPSGGIAATAQFPSASVATAITETASTAEFAGLPALSVARKPAARGALDDTATATILYLGFTTTTAVTFLGTPAVTFTLPAITPGQSYYLATYDAATTAWTIPAAGPATISGTTVSFPLTGTGTTTISPNAPLYVALYSTATASPSPSPSPRPSPNPSPSPSPSPSPPVGAVVATPTALTFTTSASTAQTFAVSESGYTGTFSAVSSTPAVATVAAGQTAGTFTVTPLESGTTTITITGASGGAAATVSVSVGAPITVSSLNRGEH